MFQRARSAVARASLQPGPLRCGILPAVLLASCADSEPATWTPVGDEIEFTSVARSFHLPWRQGRTAELVVTEDGAEVRIRVEKSDWTYRAKRGLWTSPAEYLAHDADTLPGRLTTVDGEVPAVSVEALAEGGEGWAYRGGMVGASFDEPPDEATLTFEFVDPARRPAGRILQRSFAGRGFSLLAGSRAGCRVDIPAGGVLRFGTVVQPLLAPVTEEECVFGVRVDGQLVYEHRERLARNARCDWHVVPLGEEERAGVRLEFELGGAPARGLLLDPRLGPREVGARGARPWPDPRPDIVLFVADTFRADCLSLYGGQSGIAPNLDRLARESLSFRRAWSTSTWTLPAHATMLTGQYPRRALGHGDLPVLPEALDTIVELLSRSGYRTGAVTEGGYVSASLGLAQGFDFFAERTRDLPGILEEASAFLDADDGRPTFLFVQTYRVHEPYRVSEQTRRGLGERLDLDAEFTTLLEPLLGGQPRPSHAMEGFTRTPELLDRARELHDLYLGGVADLDRELQGFLERLESDVLGSGYLVFTSDHGEAFLEHDALFHGGDPFEEQARIPLFISGRGLSGRVVEEEVSLIDLAPTLAAMAGLEAAHEWPGTSLLSPIPRRTLFGFEFIRENESLFVLAGTKKLLLRPTGSDACHVLGAFDLAADPREEQNLAAALPDWARELLDQNRAGLPLLQAPLVQGEAAVLNEDELGELRALGY